MKNRVLVVLLLATIVFSANFWGYPIYILDEAKNAACAMEMNQRGDWVTPTFNGELRTDKPPLHYFFMIGAYKVFGVNPFSARLFSVVMGIFTCMLIYSFGRKFINERSAFLAALVFICSLQVSVQFHMAVPDPYLIAFITSSIVCFFYAHLFKKSNYFYLSYISLALAFLAKGPVAIILVALPLFITLLIRKEFTWTFLKESKLIQGIGLFLLIVSPWWIAVTIQTNGEWIKGFLFDHNLNRFASTMEGHKGIPGVALATLFIALLPLSFFLPQAVWMAWKKAKEYPFILLGLLVCTTVILFFSISRTFLPGYIGPCLPFGALLIGFYLDQWIAKNGTTISQRISFLLGGLLSIVIPIGGYFALRYEFKSEEIATRALYLLPILIGAVVALVFLFKTKVQLSIYIILFSYVVGSIILFYVVLPPMINQNPVSQLYPDFSDSHEFAILKSTNSAFIFNTGKPLKVLETQDEMNSFFKEHPNAAIFSRKYNLDQIDTSQYIISMKKDLFENPVTVVIRKKN